LEAASDSFPFEKLEDFKAEGKFLDFMQTFFHLASPHISKKVGFGDETFHISDFEIRF